MFTAYVYASSGNGNGNRRTASGLFRKVKPSRKVSSGWNAMVTVASRGSAVDHEAGTPRPGHARHDLPPGRPVRGRQPVVVVDQLTVQLQYVGLALAAGPAAAQVRRVHAGRFQRFQQA